MTRVLIISHGHPEIHPGGAEIVAYTLFEELKMLRGVEAFFLARTDDPGHRRSGTHFSTFFNRPDEILLHSTETDPFLFSQLSETLLKEFAEFIEQLQPDVVHFHHYFHVGLELFAIVRRVCPNCRIVVTLHEYLAICNNNGQMVKTEGLALCSQATPAACAGCFPETPSTAFFMRQLFIQAHFERVDLFIAPSEFLRERYVEWGVPENKIVLLKYLLPKMEHAEPRPIAKGEKRSVFAFFGQLTPYKGVRVLVEAFELLEEWADAEESRLLIFGTPPIFPPDFKKWFDDFLERNPKRISYLGPYGRKDVPRLMASIDWVVVPSEWWENAPIVIEEAFAHGRPVICSDIGGMAEKVEDGVDGLHFQAGNPHALASVIRESSARVSLWDELTKRIGVQTNRSSEIQDYLRLYGLISGYEFGEENSRAALQVLVRNS